jgi:hypothetical protein
MPAKCPGQDQRYWKPEDIFDVGCPYCGREIEFWKDEPFRMCRECGREVRNPRLDLACAEWCASAEECLGHGVDRRAASPVVERLMAVLEQRLTDFPGALERARQVCARVDTLLRSETADPSIAKPAGMLAGALIIDSREEPSPPDEKTMSSLLCGAGIPEPDAEVIVGVVHKAFASVTVTDPETSLVRRAMAVVSNANE